MKNIEKKSIARYREYLENEEKSIATIQKYMHDISEFEKWLCGREITKALVLSYKAYISENYIESSAERLDTYKQIAEIASISDYKRVYASLEDTYGELPRAVENLMVIAVLKSYAAKFNVKKITVANGVGALEFPSIDTFRDARVQAALEKFSSQTRLNMTEAPVVEFFKGRDAAELMAQMTKFLKFARTFQTL